MTVTIGIVTHPQRLVYAQQLQAKVNADFICIDDGRGAHANHVKTWTELAAFDTEWALVLEDDAIPVINMTGQLNKALAVAPTNIVSGYLGKQRPPQHQTKIVDAIAKAHANNACFITSTHLFHAVAVAMRTALIPHMLNGLKSYLPIDEALGAAARHHSETISYTVPSLCNHNDQLPTLCKHRDKAPRQPGRVAHHAGTRTTWTSEAVQL